MAGPEDWQHTAWGSGHQVIIMMIYVDHYDDDGDNHDSNDYNDNDDHDKSQERLPHSCCYSTTKGDLFIYFDHVMMIYRPNFQHFFETEKKQLFENPGHIFFVSSKV